MFISQKNQLWFQLGPSTGSSYPAQWPPCPPFLDHKELPAMWFLHLRWYVGTVYEHIKAYKAQLTVQFYQPVKVNISILVTGVEFPKYNDNSKIETVWNGAFRSCETGWCFRPGDWCSHVQPLSDKTPHMSADIPSYLAVAETIPHRFDNPIIKHRILNIAHMRLPTLGDFQLAPLRRNAPLTLQDLGCHKGHSSTGLQAPGILQWGDSDFKCLKQIKSCKIHTEKRTSIILIYIYMYVY